MAEVQQFLDDLNIISQIADYPGSQEGLTTAEFKAKFDEAGLRIQRFLNDHVIPALNNYVTLGTGYVKTEGGKMTGPLEMGGNRVMNIGAPINDSDAVPKSYVMPRSGGYMTGSLNMGGHRISGVDVPEVDSDVANKSYVDRRRVVGTVTLPAHAWVGNTAPYTMSRTFAEVSMLDTPHYCVIYSENTETARAEKEAFAMIDDMESTDGSLVFVCLDKKPSVDLNIQIEIIKGAGSDNATAAFMLNNSPETSAISIGVDGEYYGVDNATVNGVAAQGSYNFNVL